MKTIILAASMALIGHSCSKEQLTYESGDLSIGIEAGTGWLHDYPLFLGINKKNPPQIAIWAEDTDGHYIATLYASRKIATQGWVGAHGNPRKEALPYWSHKCGTLPLVDVLTGATPRETFHVRMKDKTPMRRFNILVEVNHSIDWNDAYPEGAAVGTPSYSGGTEGSGQPSIIYKVSIDTDSCTRTFGATVLGHGSPDGSDGDLHRDMDGITTALTIVRRISVTVK